MSYFLPFCRANIPLTLHRNQTHNVVWLRWLDSTHTHTHKNNQTQSKTKLGGFNETRKTNKTSDFRITETGRNLKVKTKKRQRNTDHLNFVKTGSLPLWGGSNGSLCVSSVWKKRVKTWKEYFYQCWVRIHQPVDALRYAHIFPHMLKPPCANFKVRYNCVINVFFAPPFSNFQHLGFCSAFFQIKIRLIVSLLLV